MADPLRTVGIEQCTPAFISSATTTQVKIGAGTLIGVIYAADATGTIAIYDATSGTTNQRFSFKTDTVPMAFLPLNAAFTNGIRVVTATGAAPLVTILYN